MKKSHTLKLKFSLKKVLASIIVGFSTFSYSEEGSKGYFNSLTQSIGDNWTVARDKTTTSETTKGLDEEAKEEEKKCAEKQEGTQGEAIDIAIKVHIEMGAAQPDVEKFFDQFGDCFSKLNKLYDLSYSIPSLSSIMNSAQQGIVDYSKQKVCTAINEVSKIVTDPLNKAIDKINNRYAKYFDLNGLTSSLIQDGISKIDSQLGNDYLSPPKNTDIIIHSFSDSQTTFDNSDINSNVSNSNPSGNVFNNQTNQLNDLNQKLQTAQMQLPAAQSSVLNAQSKLNMCLNQGNNCTNYQTQLDQAKANLSQIQQNIQNLQSQVANLSGNTVPSGSITLSNSNNVNTASSQPAQRSTQPNNGNKQNSGSSLLNSMGNLFH